MTKKKILLVSENINRLKDLIYSEIIEDLKKQYDIEFLIENNNKFQEENYYESKIIEFLKKNNIVYSKKKSKLNNIFNKRLHELIFFFNQINKFIKIKRYKSNLQAINATLSIDKPQYTNLFKIIYLFKLSNFLLLILRSIRIAFIFFQKDNFKKKYDLVLFPWKIEPFSSFCFDIFNEAYKKKIKTLGIQLNWDSVPDRHPLFVPDYISVLGEQSFSYLFNIQSISPHRIFVNGSLKIDNYKKSLKLEKSEAKKNLNLPENKKIICFAPSGEEYDEIFILSKMEEIMREKSYNNDYAFYIKGYRGGKVRTIKDSLWNEYRETNDNQYKIYKNLIFWEPNDLKMSDQDYFINFYSAIDGIISTYSSVCLEAAFYNIPSLGLNYNPKEYGLKVRDNWVHKNYWPHTYSFRNHKIIREIEINNRDELDIKIKNFMEMVKENRFNNIFRTISALNISNYEDISVKNKILISIDNILNNPKKLEDSHQIYHS